MSADKHPPMWFQVVGRALVTLRPEHADTLIGGWRRSAFETPANRNPMWFVAVETEVGIRVVDVSNAPGGYPRLDTARRFPKAVNAPIPLTSRPVEQWREHVSQYGTISKCAGVLNTDAPTTTANERA